MPDAPPLSVTIELRHLTGTGFVDLSLEVARGEVCAVLGQNASALLRLPGDGKGRGGRLGALMPLMSVARNVGLPLMRPDMRQIARHPRVVSLLDRLDLAGVAEARPGTLTALQARRAALARALVSGPRVLLLDDPCEGLAPEDRRALLADIAALHLEETLTTVIAVRDVADALPVADRIAVLDGGRVAQLGPPGVLYEAPASPRVASAMGEVNMLRGVVAGIEDEVAEVRLPSEEVVEAVGEVSLGMRCVVCVRPERIAVARVRAEEMGGRAMPAVLRSARHLGDHLRLALALPGGEGIVVKRPLAAGLGMKAGEAVSLAWQPHHALVFPDG